MSDPTDPTSPPRAARPVLRAFLSSPTAVAALVGIGLIVVAAVMGPIVYGERATEIDVTTAFQSPGAEHWLGTDALGRDVLARLLVGARLSILLGLGATVIALVVGAGLGLSAALATPPVRRVLLRAIDTLLSFPSILTAIFVSVVLGVGSVSAMIGVGVAGSFAFARITCTLASGVAGRDYISAATVLNVPRHRIWFRYVLANIAEPLLISGSVAASHAIVSVSGLSFLGLGVRAPDFDWGQMLTEGLKAIYQAPVGALAPAAAIAVTALAFGFAGEALARAFNPLRWTAGSGRAAAAVSTEPAALPVAADAVPEPVVDPVLEVRDLVVSFPGDHGPVEVVKGVSFAVPRGQVVGIVGESGSGKSMTAMAVAQLIPHPGRVDGTIAMAGECLDTLTPAALSTLLADELAVVFQDPMSALNPALRVGSQMTMATQIHRKMSSKAVRELAAQRLGEVHIPDPEGQLARKPHEFSGGMRQRVTIATGLMGEPAVLIADEPTTALDVTVQAQIMDLLEEINERRGTAILLISHNLALVSQVCDRVLVMYHGRIVEDLDTDQLRTNARHPYTRALLGAVPAMGKAHQTLASIPGEVPEAGSSPAGCSFQPRCPVAREVCAVERPRLLRSAEAEDRGRQVACHVAHDERPVFVEVGR